MVYGTGGDGPKSFVLYVCVFTGRSVSFRDSYSHQSCGRAWVRVCVDTPRSAVLHQHSFLRSFVRSLRTACRARSNHRMHKVVDARGLALRFLFPDRASHEAIHPPDGPGTDPEGCGVEEQAQGPR